MNLAFEEFFAPGVRLLNFPRFADSRGNFQITFIESVMADHGLPFRFIQDNHSVSTVAGTLRGLHCQKPPAAQAKLVRVTRGRILDVIVDIREGSPCFRKWGSVELSAESGQQLLIPRGFLHGFITLEPMTEVQYKVDGPYSPADELTVLWSDPDLAIDWRLTREPLTSGKDGAGRLLSEIPPAFSFPS